MTYVDSAIHKQDMTALTVLDAPAVGAPYRNSTVHTWHVTKICGSGLTSLSEELYDCERHDCVTRFQLESWYAPLT